MRLPISFGTYRESATYDEFTFDKFTRESATYNDGYFFRQDVLSDLFESVERRGLCTYLASLEQEELVFHELLFKGLYLRWVLRC